MVAEEIAAERFAEEIMDEVLQIPAKPKSRRARKPAQKASAAAPAPVETVTVNAALWATALEIADGNTKRIKILAHNKVLVG